MNVRKTKYDELRRMPTQVRYSFTIVGSERIHTGLSWTGYAYVLKTDSPVSDVFITDYKRLIVGRIRETPKEFMRIWAENYNNPDWDYFGEGGTAHEMLNK